MREDYQNEAIVEAKTDEGDEAERAEQERVRKFLTLALARFKASADHESVWRKDAIDDFKFAVFLEQWDANIKSERGLDGRPCLVMDHLGQSLKQVTNEQRQQRPSIEIAPSGSGSTQNVAEVLQGMCRHVEVNSDAEVADDTAFAHMVICGRGWIRVMTEYEPGMTFDQEIKIEMVKNAFSVYDDPASVKPDGSDASYRFVVEDMPREEFKAQYKDAKATGADFSSLGDNASAWATKDAIRVAEYFYVEKTAKKIYLMSDDSVVADPEPGKAMGLEVKAEREYLEPKVKWAKITAVDILDETDVPCRWITVVPVHGDDEIVDGKRSLMGLVRRAKDPQRMYNYQCSSATEQVALAPKAPYIGPKGSFKSSEAAWKTLNTRNMPYLEYDPVVHQGAALPAPRREVAEPPIQATVLLIRQADNDIKASMGIYDASLGEKGPDQSGKAILARQKQGDIATLNFSDNLSRTKRHIGRILLDMFPKVYTKPQIRRIINPDGTAKHVGVFNSDTHDQEDIQAVIEAQEQAIKETYDIGVGTYSVNVSVGPSYQSKRQEAVASIMSLIQAFPQIMAVAGDLLVGNMDWPGAKEIAKRMKKMLPPQLADESDESPEAQLQQAQQQLQALQQQQQQLSAALAEAQDAIKTKKVEGMVKLAIQKTQVELEKWKAKLDSETKLALAEVNTKAQELADRRATTADLFKAVHQSSHDAATQAVDHAHEKDMQGAEQEQEQSQTELEQEHEKDMQAAQSDLEGSQDEGEAKAE